LEVMMKTLVTGTFVALAIASAGPAFACGEPPPAHVVHAPPAKSKAAATEAKLETPAPSADAKGRMVHPVADVKLKTVQPAVDATSKTADPTAKFEAVDADDSGSLDGAEVDAYKAVMVQIDTNKDGKLSREEFAAAVTAGTIK